MKKLMLAVLVCSLVLLAFTATASAGTPSLKSLAKTVAALQKRVNSLSSNLTAAKATIAGQGVTISAQGATISSLSTDLTSAEATITGLQSIVGVDVSHGLRLDVANLQGSVTSLTTTVGGHTTSIGDLQDSHVMDLEPYVSVNAGAMNGVAGPNIDFQGANVHVRSTTSEGDATGLGNLIVGWDNNPTSPLSGYRAGSNNLVCGDQNSFFSYGSFLAGNLNICSSYFASAYGGFENTADGGYSAVAGGLNETSGLYSTVSGGDHNKATGTSCSVSGGEFNVAGTNGVASVSGGTNVTENSVGGWSAGGTFHNP
jgi:hypothetical protein